MKKFEDNDLRIEKNFKVLIKQIEKLQVQLEKEIEQRTIK
jgi:ABC-type Zn uptake system ZnuABC Zn-binding protein ZnuA